MGFAADLTGRSLAGRPALVRVEAFSNAPSHEVPFPRILIVPNRFVPTSNASRCAC